MPRAAKHLLLSFAAASLLTSSAARAQEAVPTAAGEAENSPAITAPAQQLAAAAQAGSQARIVRLSQVKGAVELDRHTGNGFEAAFTNLPIVEGARLKTAEGVAEIEFEDNTTLRLTPNSSVAFTRLRLMPGGVTASTIEVTAGTVYASLAGTKGNPFSLSAAGSTIVPQPSSRIRLELGSPDQLAVLAGTAEVTTASGTTLVNKKKTLQFDPAASNAPMLLGKVEQGPYDDWNKDSTNYHGRISNAAFAGSSGLYGLNDLSYYGSFVNQPGCGSAWRPYFASAAWDPYANGVWAYYPGAGYSWVSPYPWGWTPFHYGSWQQCPAGGGWGWHPGGQWSGLVNAAAAGQPGRGPLRPKPPILPGAGRPTLVPVNLHPLQVSKPTPEGVFVFRNDSAGLGVPRQTTTKLNGVDHVVARYGAANVPLDLTPGGGTLAGRAGAVSPAALTGRSVHVDTSAAQAGAMPTSGGAGRSGGSSSMPVAHGSGVSASSHSAPASAPSGAVSGASAGRAGR